LQSGRASLGEDLYHAITTDYIPIEEIFISLSLKTEHSVLETMNRLEGALFAWNQRISEERSRRSPARHSWNFMKDKSSEVEKMSACIERVETLVQLLKSRFPNLPPTFVDVVKVQYNEVKFGITHQNSRAISVGRNGSYFVCNSENFPQLGCRTLGMPSWRPTRGFWSA
jgi:hypothetical protein